MHNHDPFRYRSKAEIDSSLPDLLGATPWTVGKIVKVRTSNLRLIAQAKDKFAIRLDTVWLAETYFQRFFSQYAFQRSTPVIFVAACIHLACKASDLPRPLDQVIKKTFQMRYANDEKEMEKINNDKFMFLTEVKERVLLAERALLYCFNFDFKTSDPYSYALKYNNAYKLLEGDDSQRAFAWLNIAALATTLCLQYPASVLGVVAVWYAQHLVLGEIPVDEEGLEWWEKLPTDRQGTLPVSKVTVDQVEDAHWQLVPHANWAAERERLQKAAEEAREKGIEAKGRLPGDGCHCKVCSLHQSLVDQAQQADAQGQTSPQGASDASATTTSGINLPGAMTMEAPGPMSAPTTTEQEIDAASAATDKGSKSHMEFDTRTQYSPAGGEQASVQAEHRSSPSWHGHQVGSGQHPSTSPAQGLSRHGLSATQLRNTPAAAGASHPPEVQPPLQSSGPPVEQQTQHAQHERAPHGQAYSPVVHPGSSSPGQYAYQHHDDPRHQQQTAGLSLFGGGKNEHAHAVHAVDDDSGPEEGEIEEGEVLPDDPVAEAQNSNRDVTDARTTNGEQILTGSAAHQDDRAGVSTNASGKKRNMSPPCSVPDGEGQNSSREQHGAEHDFAAGCSDTRSRHPESARAAGAHDARASFVNHSSSSAAKRKRSLSPSPPDGSDLECQPRSRRKLSPIG